ncbi:MAG: hypothetical protein R2912_12415 [Eubacteriales bacterium]
MLSQGLHPLCLTGEAYTELTDVSVANGINPNTIDYDDAIFDAFGIRGV